MVVHFNCLKFCSPDTRFTETTATEICTPTHQPDQQPVGTELEIVDAVDDDDIHNDAPNIPARRYSLRTRQPPAWFAPTIEHLFRIRDVFSSKGEQCNGLEHCVCVYS